jgi:UDP-glucose 4-epimerase
LDKIGIVGGSGYIGSAVAAHLCKTYEVRVLDMKYPPEHLLRKVDFRKCNILQEEEIKQEFIGLDLVIHAAIIQIPLIDERKEAGYEVNFRGVQNVCSAVDKTASIKGMILTGTWHVFGEQLNGTIDESFGFRPDKVESRARLYVMSKIAQEVISRYYDEMSAKIFGVIRMGTVLGKGMPEKTAANLFISKGLKGEPLTPFKHSMYRPMLYIDIRDVCEAYAKYADKILQGRVTKEKTSLAHVVNLCFPNPVTIIELANMVRDNIIELTEGRIEPRINIIDTGEPVLYNAKDKEKMKVDVTKVSEFLEMKRLIDPRLSIRELVREAIGVI